MMDDTRYGRAYWEGRSDLEDLRSVLDEKDRRGHKNRYIDIIQKMALQEVFEPAGRVLDLGCGGGRFSRWLGERSRIRVGVDIAEGMLRRIRDSFPVLYDGRWLPFRDGAFDAILAVGVLQDIEGVDAHLALLEEVHRCLADDGRVYLVDQCSDDPGRPWRSARVVEEACRAAGFRVHHQRCIRRGRALHLYLIRYGLVPSGLLARIARWEIRRLRGDRRPVAYYRDHLFILGKG